MSCYISSNLNRFYAKNESQYGVTPEIAANNRMPSVSLKLNQTRERVRRRDKTGSRTFQGLPVTLRRSTEYALKTYLTGWDQVAGDSGYAPMIAAALGTDGLRWDGATVASASGTSVTFSGPHGLQSHQAVSVGGEIRFVSAILDDRTIELNAAFTVQPGTGEAMGPTLTFFPGDRPKSASIFDYWSPAEAVQRVVCGALVDEMKIAINGDFHEFEFSGPAADVVASSGFEAGQAGLQSFPAEPAPADFPYSVVPGHLGQAWIGAVQERLLTLTSAEVRFKNNVELRADEFGMQAPACYTAGEREVSVRFSVYERDDDLTRGLYAAARLRMPVSVMFQLGQQAGQLCGLYMKSVLPEVPEFKDSGTRVEWQFEQCRAEGANNDEFVLALA